MYLGTEDQYNSKWQGQCLSGPAPAASVTSTTIRGKEKAVFQKPVVLTRLKVEHNVSAPEEDEDQAAGWRVSIHVGFRDALRAS